MNLTVRIPDELADRIRGADPARLERAALAAVLRAVEDDAFEEQRAVAGIVSDFSPSEAAARMRAARPDNRLPDGVTIHALMTHGRA